MPTCGKRRRICSRRCTWGTPARRNGSPWRRYRTKVSAWRSTTGCDGRPPEAVFLRRQEPRSAGGNGFLPSQEHGGFHGRIHRDRKDVVSGNSGSDGVEIGG